MWHKCRGQFSRVLASVTLAMLASGVSSGALSKDYGVTIARPNKLFVVDLDALTIETECEFPGRFSTGTLVMSPDGRVAYFVANSTGTLFGMNVNNCEVVFRADQSSGDLRVRSLASLAVSRDGKQLYTIQHRTHLLIDRYQVVEPHFAVFDTDAGLKAKPARSFPIPRQIQGLAETGKDGLVTMLGPDIYTIDPENGHLETVSLSRSWERPLMTPPDGVASLPNGAIANELARPYVTVKFADDNYDMATAQFLWGYTRVDLTTGEVVSREIGDFEGMMFSAISHPKNPDLVYGVSQRIQVFDAGQQKRIRAKDLPHSFYAITMAADGSRIYLSGAMNVIAVYDTQSLELIGNLELPAGDMVFSPLQIVSR